MENQVGKVTRTDLNTHKLKQGIKQAVLEYLRSPEKYPRELQFAVIGQKPQVPLPDKIFSWCAVCIDGAFTLWLLAKPK